MLSGWMTFLTKNSARLRIADYHLAEMFYQKPFDLKLTK